ncbi:MAG TPA: hypothetical protein VIP77_05180 [Jiangellaceae bacterium]
MNKSTNKMPPTIPLFDEPARVRKPKNRSVPSVAWGNCPGCRKGRVGVIRTATHLVWREHTYMTWGGTSMTCTASGVPVCRATERTPTLLQRGRVTCDHERTYGGAVA